MNTGHHRGLAALQGAVAVCAGVCATIGLWFRGSDGTRIVDGLYGESEVLVGGFYAGNSPAMVAEGIGWDLVTLVGVVPALLILAVGVWRGSVHARIASCGGLFYCLYQYHQYAITYAFGPLFPAFIAVAALALVALALTLGSLPALAPTTSFLRRLMVAIMTAVPLVLVVMWAGRIAAAMPESGRAEVLGHYTTLPVQVMDLVWLAPSGLLIAVLILRRVPVGYLAGAVLAVKGAAMGFAIAAMLVAAGRLNGEFEIVPLVMFTTMGAVCVLAAIGAVRALQPGSAHGAVGQPPPSVATLT